MQYPRNYSRVIELELWSQPLCNLPPEIGKLVTGPQCVNDLKLPEGVVLGHRINEWAHSGGHAMQAICRCGQVHTGQFPVGVNAGVQYGPRAQAAMVHLNQNHAVSIQRTAALMQDFFGLAVSQATVVRAALAGADILQPTVQGIGQAAVSSAVLHADETGMRVAKKLHWLHVLATDTLTWMGCHPKRGTEAFEGLALLQQFQGVLVHDGWMPYKALQCQHALCNAHHLRELTYLLQEQSQAWAGDMIEVLTHASHLDNVNCAEGQSPNYGAKEYQSQVRGLRDLYDAILAQAQADNPIAPSTGKRGRPKQSKATNLIGRLRDYSDDVWRFMTQADVPFTNNLAEQAVRMPKVKQKSLRLLSYAARSAGLLRHPILLRHHAQARGQYL